MNSLEAFKEISKRLADVPYQEELNTIQKDLEKFQAIENKGLKYEDDILSFEDNQGRRLVVNDTLVDYYVKYSAIENADLSEGEKDLEQLISVTADGNRVLSNVKNAIKKSKLLEEENKELKQRLKLLKINFDLKAENEKKIKDTFTAEGLNNIYKEMIELAPKAQAYDNLMKENEELKKGLIELKEYYEDRSWIRFERLLKGLIKDE